MSMRSFLLSQIESQEKKAVVSNSKSHTTCAFGPFVVSHIVTPNAYGTSFKCGKDTLNVRCPMFAAVAYKCPNSQSLCSIKFVTGNEVKEQASSGHFKQPMVESSAGSRSRYQ